jgi:AAA domain
MSFAPNDEEFRERIAEYNRENPRPISKTNGGAPTFEVIPGGATTRKAESRIKLVPFDEIKLGTERRFLVKGLIPRSGLVIVWGPPKCGKSFWTFDLVMHVALGWEYRGRRVQQGAVVYCAFEGQKGFEARVEAFRQKHLDSKDIDRVPFFLEPVTLDLVQDHAALIAAVRTSMGSETPVTVVLDTLNRSLRGSESSDEDMTAYIKAADAIREAFECAVIIVHHCGLEGTRPRGHTSLTGAADAQISVKRDGQGTILVEVECAKDGPQGDLVASRLENVVVGTDEDGEDITSCIVVTADTPSGTSSEGRLTPNQQTMYRILHATGPRGLSLEDWYEQTRAEGIGTKRRATLGDLRDALHTKGLITQTMNGWAVKQPA